MKTINITFILVLISFLTIQSQAQIKVSVGGQVKIFGDRPQDDPFNDLSMQVFGPYGE